MKLAAKLTITLVLGIVAVMGIYAWVQIASEVVLSEGDATGSPGSGPSSRCGRERARRGRAS